ncbi:phage tail tape measure protein [Staphylococcus gallinarum]|uniref:phage tail tape measure protein n=1 Tax=Staphylococcus gallinarum TaxID=1293 RepID=UPI00316E386E
MPGNVEGLTIINKIDNTQVDQGMTSLGRQLKVVNSQMRANLSEFEKSEKSMKKYQVQIKGLNNKFKIQKQMFKQAEHELEQLNSTFKDAKNRVSSVEIEFKKLVEINKKNKNALDQSNAELKENNIALKKAKDQLNKTNGERDKAYQKLRQLRKAEQDLKNNSKATTTQLNKASLAVQKQSAKHKDLVAKYKTENEAVKNLKNNNEKLKATNEKVSNTYTKTNAKLQQTEKEYNDLNKTILNYDKNLTQAQTKVNNEKTKLNQLSKAIKKTEKEMQAFNKQQLIANSHFTKNAKRLDKMSEKYRDFGQGMSSIGRNMSMYVTTPIAGAMGYAAKLGVEFDDSMRKVQATSGASGKQLDQLKEQARKMGATTKFSATDSAEALNYMALAGWKTNSMIKGLPGIMDLAAASGEDLAQVSDIVTDGLTAFGLKAKDSGHFADVLAKTSASANTNVGMMGEAFKYAAPVAGALGYSIEDTSLAIGLMSNAGIKGEKAGTALRTMFTNLSKPTREMKNQMDALGISMTDSNGQMLPMRDVLDQLRDKFSGLSKKQQASAAATIFGKESMSGALAVINASEKDYNKLADSIDNSEGSAKKMSKTMEGGLGGSLRELRSASEELGLSIYETLQPALAGMVKGVKAGVDFVNKLPQGAKLAAVGLGVFAAATGPVVVGLGLLLRAIGSAYKGYAQLNKQMAINSAEAVANANANKVAGGSLATSGKATKGSTGLFSKLGNVLSLTTGRFGGLGKVALNGAKIFGKVGVPLTILTTIFGVAYEKMGWFRRGFSDMGKAVNQVGATMDFSWIGKMTKDISSKWEWLKKDMARGLQDGALFKGIKVAFDGLHKAVSKATDKTNVFGKGVSKGTKKALSAYNELSEKAKVKLESIRITHEKIGNKQYNEIKSLYGKINKEVSKQLDKRHDSEIKGLQKIFNRTNGLSRSEESKILENTKKSNRKESREAKRINKQILDIYAKAHREKRSLTKKENDKVADLQRQLDKTVVKSLSKGEVEQKAILERMKQNKGKLSMEAASKVIKESARERDNSIKSAKKKYKDTVAEAVRQRDETGNLSKAQADKVIKDAKEQYEQSKDKAKKQHKDVVDQAQKQNKGVKKNIDAQTGHVKSKWEIMKDDSVGGAKHIAKKVTGFFKDTHESANKFWDKIGRKVGGKAKGAYDDSKKWFGKTFKTSDSKFKDTKNSSDRNWNKIGKKISDKTKGAYDSARKWFNKTFKKSDDSFKDTKKSGDKNWNKIGKKISDKTKGAYNDARKWFGKTFSKSDEKFKDTKKSGDKHWNKLGKKIADKTKGAYQDARKWFGKTFNTSDSKFKDTKKSGDKWWNRLGKKIADKTKDSFNAAKKWFGKTFNTSDSRFKDINKSARNYWNKISDKIQDKAKDSFNSTKKWFGRMYNNSRDRFKDMLGRAKDNFNKIAGEGEDKSKKTHNSWKKWLGRTLDWIKNIKKDFGSAASDLGKSVANKAIDGLNGMIGGINKIAKAITDKNLIKEIPKLSTGTYNGTSLATDSDGGLRQPTLAVVNDRGSGNAPGGGVQEVIHRADGTLEAPQGRNVVVGLGVGDSVINARDTKRYSDMGVLPKLAGGTHTKRKDFLSAVGDTFKDFASRSKEIGHKGMDAIGGKAKKVKKAAGKVVETGSDIVDKGEDIVEGAMKGIKGIVDNVEDFIDKPGDLVNLVMSKMNINFGSGSNATVSLAKLAYEKLKKSLIDKVKSWFEEFGSGGGYNPFADWSVTRGWTSGGHAGIDYGAPTGKPIPSPLDGTVIQSWFSPNQPSGGNETQIYDGHKYTHIFMHQSKRKVQKGDKVHQGQIIGLVGNTGNSFGSHLHWQVNKGKGYLNNHPDSINPLDWVKEASKGGGSKAPSAWKSDIRRAAKQMRVSITDSDVNRIASLIQHESGGNAGVTQSQGLRDINVLNGNPAKGLLQYVPGTFNNYAVKGHKNIFSGYDQLLAFFNNKYWRSQFNPNGGWSPSGPRRFANGGMITHHQIAEMGEGNKPEMVIPLTKRTRAIQLIEQAMRYIGMDTQSTNVTVNNDTTIIEKLLKQMVAMNDHNNRLTATIVDLLKSTPKGADSRKAEQLLSQLQGDRYARTAYNMGG